MTVCNVRDLKSQSKRKSERRTSRLRSSHLPYPSSLVMQTRKRSSSSVKSLPRLLPYLIWSVSHGLSVDVTLFLSASAILAFSRILRSPSSTRRAVLSKSEIVCAPRDKKASE